MTEIKLRGHVKVALLHDLAAAVKTQTELAKQYGVTDGRISQFKTENASRIEKIRENIDDQISTSWIADRNARIEEYADDVERINDTLDKKVDSNLFNAKHRALRSAAEETGQLSSNFIAKVEYNVTGVDPETLK